MIILSSPVFAQKWQVVDKKQQERNSRFNLARRLENQGRREQALNLYKSLFNDMPQNQQYYRPYINLLFSLERFQEAEPVIRQYQSANPGDPEGGIDLGRLYYVTGDGFHSRLDYQ